MKLLKKKKISSNMHALKIKLISIFLFLWRNKMIN